MSFHCLELWSTCFFNLARKLLKIILVKRMPKSSHRPVKRKLLRYISSQLLFPSNKLGFHIVKRGRQRVKKLFIMYRKLWNWKLKPASQGVTGRCTINLLLLKLFLLILQFVYFSTNWPKIHENLFLSDTVSYVRNFTIQKPPLGRGLQK